MFLLLILFPVVRNYLRKEEEEKPLLALQVITEVNQSHHLRRNQSTSLFCKTLPYQRKLRLIKLQHPPHQQQIRSMHYQVQSLVPQHPVARHPHRHRRQGAQQMGGPVHGGLLQSWRNPLLDLLMLLQQEVTSRIPSHPL